MLGPSSVPIAHFESSRGKHVSSYRDTSHSTALTDVQRRVKYFTRFNVNEPVANSILGIPGVQRIM